MKKILLIISFGVFSLFFSQYTEQINTSSFHNSVPPSTHIDGLDENSISYQNINSTEFKKYEVENNKTSVKAEKINESSNADKIVEEMFPNKNKIDITSTVDIRDTHEQLPNSDTWTPKKSIVSNEKDLSPNQFYNENISIDIIIIVILLGIFFLIIIAPTVRSLLGKNKHYNRKHIDKRNIIITGGGQSEMREFIRTAFKKIESEIRKNESYQSNSQMRERIIEVIYNISKDSLYPEILKFKIKYEISESEAKQVIDEEFLRYVIMLN
jgi:hypothetical protein